jgi:hypothetical protein
MSNGVLPLVTSVLSQPPPLTVVVPTLMFAELPVLETGIFCEGGTEPPIWKPKFSPPEGVTVIACGGGGVPIYRDAVLGLEGVDAVVDKDLAAAVLARELGADLFLILTDVDAVYTGWGTEQQRAIGSMTVGEADRLMSEGAFGEGSMAPKVAAAADYVRRTQGRAIITELSKGRAAVQGIGGTEIIPERQYCKTDNPRASTRAEQE